jgi:hypothetical protein
VVQLSGAQLTYYQQLLQAFKAGSIISVWQYAANATNALPVNAFTETIQPYCNFDDVGDTQYFSQVSGAFYILIDTKEIANASTLINRNTWVAGTTYSKNDYVLQSGQTGVAADGNGNSYVCITPLSATGFVSNIPPSRDTYNWRPLQYVTALVPALRTAVLYNGAIQLANPATNTRTPFVGYMPRHYRYVRDNRLGIKNHQWLGCKQTNDTTIDGRPVVEITLSAGDVLVVSTGAPPIQQSGGASGPILNIQ